MSAPPQEVTDAEKRELIELPSKTELALLRLIHNRTGGGPRFSLLNQRMLAAAMGCHTRYAGDCLRRLARDGYLEKNSTTPRGWRVSVAGRQFLAALDALEATKGAAV